VINVLTIGESFVYTGFEQRFIGQLNRDLLKNGLLSGACRIHTRRGLKFPEKTIKTREENSQETRKAKQDKK